MSKVRYNANGLLNNKTNVQQTQTGSYIAVAGIIVSILAHYNVVVSQDSIIAIIAGAVTAYGIIHQIIVTRKATKVLPVAGKQV